MYKRTLGGWCSTKYIQSEYCILGTVFRNCWRRQWHPTPVLLPGKSHGQRSLVGCSPWGRKSRTWLNDFTFTFHFHALEKEMAPHSSVLAWRIPQMEGPGGLLSMGLHTVGHNWSDLAQYASKSGKLSSGHRIGKGQFSFQCQRMFKLPHNCTHFKC